MNPSRGEQTIKLKGREYLLRPTFGALMEFETKAGVSVFKALSDMSPKDGENPASAMDGLSVRIVAAAVWAGIRGGLENKNKAPSFEVVGEAIVEDGVMQHVLTAANFLAAGISTGRENAAADPTTAG